MTKKHYIQIAICSLVILLATALFNYYYKEYIAPESFVIGNVELEDYKTLPIKDYLTDENVLFSQNINDVSFSNKDGVATYEYSFAPTEFNGEKNSYIIYVNDYILNNIPESTNAGTISGIHNLNYYDTEKQVLCSSDITINFSFYSLTSKLKVTLPSEDLGYLMNYFKTDNFIITLAHNPFVMMDKDGEVDEVIKQLIDLSNQVVELNSEISTKNTQINDYLQRISELTQSDEDKSEEIVVLKENVKTLESEVKSLNSELKLTTLDIENLESENASLLETNSQLQALIENQKTTIEQLNKTIEDLQFQVDYYVKLLEEYEIASKIAVTFRVDNEAISVQLVDEGEYAIVPSNPEKASYSFDGWSIDGVNIVDVATTPITEDTVFTAVFTKINPYSITKTNVAEMYDEYNGYEQCDTGEFVLLENEDTMVESFTITINACYLDGTYYSFTNVKPQATCEIIKSTAGTEVYTRISFDCVKEISATFEGLNVNLYSKVNEAVDNHTISFRLHNKALDLGHSLLVDSFTIDFNYRENNKYIYQVSIDNEITEYNLAKGESISIADPFKSGYTFTGWSLSETTLNEYSAVTMPDIAMKDKVIYAIFETYSDTINVNFDNAKYIEDSDDTYIDGYYIGNKVSLYNKYYYVYDLKDYVDYNINSISVNSEETFGGPLTITDINCSEQSIVENDIGSLILDSFVNVRVYYGENNLYILFTGSELPKSCEIKVNFTK